MWKRLVVGLDGSEWADAAARHACAFAKKYAAEVEGVFVSDIRLIAPPLPPADMLGAPLDVPGEPYVALEESERRRGAAVLESFALRSRAEGVAVTTVLESGVPTDALLARLAGADAMFVGRRGRTAGTKVGGTVRAVGLRSVRPVFVAPRDVREIRRILVAYDGSPEALRALRVACELADRGAAGFSYVLLTVDADLERARETQRDPVKFFVAHGIEPERVVRPGPTGQAIIAAAKELRCDMIVAGSFGQNRLREMLLGSVTQDLLRDSDVPVLMHH